ncbi:MAG: hypothetical protein ED556_06565 [Winogradskyella sp.]|uniref:VOC family protein n=1 Tax=Winogradskyella sp. TaxID=1883156 RepID=UPI000F40D04D|nr:VOC family protein [Winogradskyella sp.]RNC87082.1 MAG: hypothetical protein ED556_06565 [Winogradskyella sp.]
MKRIAPQWIVENVAASVEFYSQKLGFTIDFLGKKPLFAIISRGDVSLMLRQLKQPNFSRPNRKPFVEAGWHTDGAEAWDAYVWVDEVDALYNEFKSKNVSIVKEIQNTEYGNRDFEIEDLDGYILCFGESID